MDPNIFTINGRPRANHLPQIHIQIANVKDLTLGESQLPAPFKLVNQHTLNKLYPAQPEASKTIDNTLAHRPNHNGTHSARKARFLDALFDFIEQKGSPEAKEQLRQLAPQEKLNLKLAAYLLRSGSVDESSSVGWDPDKDHFVRSREIYRAYAEQLKVDPNTISWIEQLIWYKA